MRRLNEIKRGLLSNRERGHEGLTVLGSRLVGLVPAGARPHLVAGVLERWHSGEAVKASGHG